MNDDFREVGLGTFAPNDKAREYIDDILDSGRISYGKYSRALESRFSELHECKYGVLSNSGTSSLQVALQAMKELYGWKDGDIVFVPASTFVATVNIVLHCNLKPVLVDVSLDDYAMDTMQLMKTYDKIIKTNKENIPRCIIPVHPFGQPADMDGIMYVAKKFDLRVIEDSCEAMFVSSNSMYGERMTVGSFGDVACFSFYVAHLVVAGVGGISITNDEELSTKIRSLVNHGRNSKYITIDDDKKFDKDVIKNRFKFTSIGHSFRITEFESALALSQLDNKSIDHMLNTRIANAQMLMEIIRESSIKDLVQLPVPRPGAEHAYMMFPILLDELLCKDDLVLSLEKMGIETRDMLPIINQPVYHRLLNIDEKNYVAANQINNFGFYVGCHQDLSEADIKYLAKSIILCVTKQLSDTGPIGKLDDLAGQKFNRLTVLNKRISKQYKKGTQISWLCKCDCGNTTYVVAYKIKSGHTKSCGCYKRDCKRLEPSVVAANAIFDSYQRGAAQRNLSFELSRSEFDLMTQANCYYCNSGPMGKYRSRSSEDTYRYNGIDRVNNKLGYITNNCVTCCATCNRMKLDATELDFLSRVSRISQFQKTKGVLDE